MLQRFRIHIDPAIGGSEWAVFHDVGWALLGNDMQEVIGDGFLLAGGEVVEDGFALFGSDGDEVTLKAGFDVSFDDDFLERASVFIDTEDRFSGGGVDDIGLLSAAVFPQPMFCEVHDFLRCSGALDGHGGDGEDGISALEVLEGVPGRIHGVVVVIATDPVFADIPFESFDGVPVELNAERHDELIVGKGGAGGEFEAVVLGVESFDAVLNPCGTGGDEVLGGSS